MSAQVSSAGAVGEPTPSRLANHPKMRALVEQLRGHTRTLANQHERVDFRQTACQLAQAAHGVVEDLHLVAGKHLKAIEFTNCILVVVEYGNFHRASLVLQRTMKAIDAVISFPVPTCHTNRIWQERCNGFRHDAH